MRCLIQGWRGLRGSQPAVQLPDLIRDDNRRLSIRLGLILLVCTIYLFAVSNPRMDRAA